MVRQRERFTVAESFLERDSKVIAMEANDIVENSNTLQDLVLAPPITGNLNVSAIGVRHPAAQELEKEVREHSCSFSEHCKFRTAWC